VRDVYAELVDVLVDGDPAAAFVATERGRARSIVEAQRARDAADEAPAIAPATLGEAQQLAGQATLVSLWLGARRSHAWVVDRRGWRYVALPERAKLDALAASLVEAIDATRPIAGEATAAARQRGRVAAARVDERAAALAAAVLSPLELGGPPVVALITDSGLAAVPWSLVFGIAGPEVAIVPSATWLRQARATPTGRVPADPSAVPAAVVVADPIYASDDGRLGMAARGPGAARPLTGEHARLARSADEAAALTSLLRGRPIVTALGGDATVEVVISEAARRTPLLHVGAHGLIDEAEPARTHIALSGWDTHGNVVPSALDVATIRAHRYDAELVTLSSCRSLGGTLIRGEGFVGLTHAFLAAGARRVLGTLWATDDAATADLMRDFYRAYLGGGNTATAALQHARLVAARRGLPPSTWAAFVLVGDWR
jgi:hypothetical protein